MNETVKPFLWTLNQLHDGTHPIKLEYYIVDGKKRRRIRRNAGVYVTRENWKGKYPDWVKKSDPLYRIKNQQIFKAISSLGSEKKEEKMDFYSFFEIFMKQKENVGYYRKRYYIRTLEKLRLFEKVYKYSITFDSLNDLFIEKFKKHLIAQEYHTNTVRMYVKVVRSVLRKSLIKGFHTNRSFEDEAWQIPEVPTKSFYLSENVINQIFISSMPAHLEKVRDLFIMGCYLGLRFSDLMSTTYENIGGYKGISVLRIEQQKTGNIVTIPIKPIVMDIFKKYNGLPISISNQSFNKKIKEIARIAKFAKSAEVTSHIMRRSFATNGYLAGIPSIDLMQVTGHRSESAFLKYIKVSREETAERLSNHPFFS
jgi:integrase